MNAAKTASVTPALPRAENQAAGNTAFHNSQYLKIID